MPILWTVEKLHLNHQLWFVGTIYLEGYKTDYEVQYRSVQENVPLLTVSIYKKGRGEKWEENTFQHFYGQKSTKELGTVFFADENTQRG